MFSDKSYATHLEVKGWIVNSQQLSKLFDPNNTEEPTQKKCDQLFDERNYLVVQILNKSEYRAWGTLECTIRPGFSVTLDVHDIAPYSIKHQPDYYGTPFGKGITLCEQEETAPRVSFEWKRLYRQ